MNQNEFQKTMLDLAACRLSPEEWSAWWTAHEASAREFLSPGEYLGLKPVPHDFRWVPVLTSRKEAVRYLEKNGVPFASSSAYQENYESELADYVKLQKAKEKELLAALKAKHPRLFAAYPRFCNSLKNAFSKGDSIEPGLTEAEIKAAPYALPPDIEAFFRMISVIALDGVSIDFSAIREETLRGKAYLVLGEFWKEADGDLLLIRPGETIMPTPIYYYCHEIDKVKKLCASIDDLMEKKFSYHNNTK
jgi:hypothetical protein